MRINSIELNNFGSYEGLNFFHINPDSDKTIVLVGGKNGAGKTTLFTAMRVCLYGYMSMGYKNFSSYYTKAITKLINNKVKLVKPAQAGVKLSISIVEGRDSNNYMLSRSWILTNTLEEKFVVKKNGELLDEEETSDFEKYLLNLIPPELFNLYFFDGEKIADFFLEDGGNNRIKEAFLTLCGYDTFAIMEKNFRRVHQQSSATNSNSSKYFEVEAQYLHSLETIKNLKTDLEICLTNISSNSAEIKQLEESYSKSGGITNEEWNKLLDSMKSEEKKREELNAWIKKVANDTLPFLMIRDQLTQLKEQIAVEEENKKYFDFDDIIASDYVQLLAKNDAEKEFLQRIQASVRLKHKSNVDILSLSPDDKASMIAIINRILAFDTDSIVDAKKKLKRSINKTAKIRKELEQSNVDSVSKYMQEKSRLFEEKSSLLNRQIEIESNIHNNELNLKNIESLYNSERAKFEDALKKESISDISGKAILMLQNLQESLYRKQIAKVEESFLQEIKVLIRKEHFIDDIHIDDDFNIHLYRNEEMPIEVLKKAIIDNKDFENSVTYKQLFKIWDVSSNAAVIRKLWDSKESEFVLPIEIDKTHLSNGEKQIFIMALYHSLVKLCNHEIPFIIDTPFARIDSEHRNNISKHFFSELNGQVFILSTNEEIKSDHVSMMKDKIASVFMLENTDNSRTQIVANTYFEA